MMNVAAKGSVLLPPSSKCLRLFKGATGDPKITKWQHWFSFSTNTDCISDTDARRPSEVIAPVQPHGKALFDKILIANRGEIACRVIRTARRLGIKTVAVYSEADWDSKHVRLADESVLIGAAASSKSYLNMEAIVHACQKTGAQAVHPGYGFLSENCAFSRRLSDLGIAFIGPGPHSIEAMGDKIESKKLAQSAGVNIIPGHLGVIADEDEAMHMARSIGYPVMIKASAGGGGKGMRVAWNDADIRDGFRLCQDEAKNSFGDNRMLIEKFIDNPRHIEIQLMADAHGNVVYLAERECSIQRRNQKVIEEAPSTFIDEKTRRAMGEQAVALAKAVNYRSAGTVEMLIDSDRNFYFLEMNTRLQVEHPVTEYITGVDLVEHMIRVAAGEKLALSQAAVGVPQGWAIECRIYAEDPYRNFLPATGRLPRYAEPGSVLSAMELVGTPGPHYSVPVDVNLRTDSGIFEGCEISMFYDPLISKLISYGTDRDAAIRKMKDALDAYVIRGVRHNVPFCRAVMEHPRFVSGDVTTKFIPQEWPNGFTGIELTDQQKQHLHAAAIALFLEHEAKAASVSGRQASYVPPLHTDLHVLFDNHNTHVKVLEQSVDVGVRVRLNIESHGVSTGPVEVRRTHTYPQVLQLHMGEAGMREAILQVVSSSAHKYKIIHIGQQFEVCVYTPLQARLAKHMKPPPPSADSNHIISPMPGSVCSVSVAVGDKVVDGQEVVVIEAMKMQNMVRAPKSGIVAALLCKKGDTVAADQVLVRLA